MPESQDQPQDQPPESKLGRRSYDELIDDPSLTEEELNAELNAYAKALADDLEKKNSQAGDTEQVQNNTKEFFQRNAAMAAAQVAWLANNAYSESVKLAAAKFIIQGAVTNENKDIDPLADLMRELKEASANKQKKLS